MIKVKKPTLVNMSLGGLAIYSKQVADNIIEDSLETEDEKRFFYLVKELAVLSEKLDLKSRR